MGRLKCRPGVAGGDRSVWRGCWPCWSFSRLLSAIAQGTPDTAKPDLDVPDAPSAIGAPIRTELQVPSGGRALAIIRIQDIPQQLDAAAERAKCQVAEHLLTNHPVLIFRPADGYRVMAVVPCHAIVPFSRAFLFEQSLETEPIPMTFPVVAPNGGISASSQPGLMTWDAQTRTLFAWRGQRLLPGARTPPHLSAGRRRAQRLCVDPDRASDACAVRRRKRTGRRCGSRPPGTCNRSVTPFARSGAVIVPVICSARRGAINLAYLPAKILMGNHASRP